MFSDITESIFDLETKEDLANRLDSNEIDIH